MDIRHPMIQWVSASYSLLLPLLMVLVVVTGFALPMLMVAGFAVDLKWLTWKNDVMMMMVLVVVAGFALPEFGITDVDGGRFRRGEIDAEEKLET